MPPLFVTSIVNAPEAFNEVAAAVTALPLKSSFAFAPTVSVTESVGLLLRLTPLALALLIVKLFNAVTLFGRATPVAVPPKTKLEADVAVKFAGVPAMAGPFSVRVFVPILNAPLVRVSVPLSVGLLFKLTPLALLIVRLFNAVTLLGMTTELEEPPKTKLEEDVVVKFAGVPAMAGPFSVSVFAPTANAPLVSVSVLATVGEAPKTAPDELANSRLP